MVLHNGTTAAAVDAVENWPEDSLSKDAKTSRSRDCLVHWNRIIAKAKWVGVDENAYVVSYGIRNLYISANSLVVIHT